MTESALDASDAVEQLCSIFDEQRPVAETAERAMQAGTKFFEVDNGHLASIVAETDLWEIIASTDPVNGEFTVGRTVDLQRTFCRKTLARDSVLALHDVPTQGWDNDIAYETHELGCYFGAPIRVDGEQYGTLCFVDHDSRSEPFSDAERQFLELLTRMFECEIERQQRELALTRGSNLVDVFSRILRHNLRNDMTLVRGRIVQLLDDIDDVADVDDVDGIGDEKDIDDSENVGDAGTLDGGDDVPAHKRTPDVIETIDDLLALSDKAREIEAVVHTDFEQTDLSVQTLVRTVITTLESTYPQATFSLESTADATIVAMPTIETALSELFENAATHAGPSPTVTVTVDTTIEHVQIVISDDGPGLSIQEMQVVSDENETPLIHGSGLGLWMVDWIVTSNDGTIEIASSDAGTTVTVTLPRALANGSPA